MTHLLEVQGLTKSFARQRRSGPSAPPAIADVSFTLERGETLALVGESGAGKSTTGRLILRLIEPDSGLVLLDGEDVREIERREGRRWRRRAQMIFQDPYSSFDPRITIGESIGEPLLIHGQANKAARRERAGELLQRVGMGSHFLDRFPRELSGGQLQRAAVARALTTGPDLIVCDEPVAALDVSIRAQVLNLLKDVQEEFGLAYLFITHDLSLVEVVADRVAVMRNGAIVETGETGPLYRSPQHPYTAELLSAIPTLPAATSAEMLVLDPPGAAVEIDGGRRSAE